MTAGDGFGEGTLPYGVDDSGHVVVAWRDEVIDLTLAEGLDVGPEVFAGGSLNAFFAEGPAAWALTRSQLSASAARQPARARRPLAGVPLRLPWQLGDFSDFYSSREHATNMGRLLRPGEDPLPPAWVHVPLGYHGRAGSVVVSGTPVQRPWGVTAGAGGPLAGPSSRLDAEAEIGFVVGTGVPRGTGLAVEEAERVLFGVVLVNDWSARDIQAFEYRPLGPFNGKSFATSVSAWVVPLAALEPWRVPGPAQEPPPPPHLRAPEPRGLDVELTLEVNGEVLSRMPAAGLYWSPAQMLAHLTANGSGLRAGDLLATGTVSGPGPGGAGSLMERFGGEAWLADGDTVVVRGSCGPAGAPGRVLMGEVSGTVVAAAGRAAGR